MRPGSCRVADHQGAHMSSEPGLDVDVVVVGAGFSGLYLLHELRRLGFSSRVLESADDVGGTWYWNRYPGAACDVESYIYLPLLEEIGYIPKEKYSKAPEILAHSQAIGRHFDLYRNADRDRLPKARKRKQIIGFPDTETPVRWAGVFYFRLLSATQSVHLEFVPLHC